MDELLSIGEFSQRCGLSPKMLRSYADAGLLAPAAVDRDSGYRYYAPGQVHEARVVATLRQAGIPVADIRLFVERPTAGVLDEWERLLGEEFRIRREALARVRELVVLEVESGVNRPAGERARGGRPMAMLVSSVATHIGLVREANEDNIVAGDTLVAVADGMGGAPGGALAARIAVDTVLAAWHGGDLSGLRDAIVAANAAVWSRSRTDADLDGMGTTICVAAVVEVDGETRIGVAHVGDSRAYLVRDGSLAQLTEDHTVVADLVRRGELAPSDVAGHPYRHVLTRVLGMGPAVDADVTVITPQAGDRLLLCTDGLHNELSDERIEALLTSATAPGSEAAEALVAAALDAGGRDNVSVALVDVALDPALLRHTTAAPER